MDLTIFLIGFLCSSIGFVIYYYVISLKEIKKVFISGDEKESNTRHIIFSRMFGVFIFGLIPSIYVFFFTDVLFKDLGLAILPPQRQSLWMIIMVITILSINYMNGKKKDNLMMYPQIREKEWTMELVIVSALSWIIYLFAYEFLFRGILLFSSFRLFGYWPAVLINIGIYSLVHIPKGAKEALGSIPFGLILSVLVLSTGTFWIAFFVHIILALSNEWFSIYFHPEMRLKR